MNRNDEEALAVFALTLMFGLIYALLILMLVAAAAR